MRDVMKRVNAPGICAILMFGSNLAWSETSPSISPGAAECQALASADFSGVMEAPTQVTSAQSATTEAVIAHCQVKGVVTPNVGFELLLPLKWNGKFMHMGSGGHGGATSPQSCATALQRGYACLTSDMGHQSTMGDGKWGYNNLQAEIDWGYRATHVATLAGKAITSHFYGSPPARSYFAGCSTGGRQALQAAQRFPWDFDGILAGAPPIRLADLYVTFAWGQRVARDAAGKPVLGMGDLKLLTEAALAKCDMDDGVKDGVIGAPLNCPFRPSTLACKAGQTSGCLSAGQVTAAERIYSGPTSHGRPLFGGGAPPGSEFGGPWNEKFGGNWGIYYAGTNDAAARYSNLTLDGFRYLFFSPDPGPSWSLEDFDFDRDYKRLDVMQSLYDSSNPDLTRFKAAGGKMLIYHGMNDLSILPHWIIDYYKKVERVMGGRAQTVDFVRLFTLPGVEHCAGGPGADTVDYLTALEQWVEQGRAPEKLIAYRLQPSDVARSPISFPPAKDSIIFSRPVFPYPARAQYLGRGNPDDAASFRSVDP